MRRSFCLLRPMGDEIRVEASYDEAWKEGLKRLIPAHARRWDGQRYWFVQPQHRATLEQLATAMAVAEWQEGALTVNLHTGQRSEQLELF